ncbi:hypothetical protein ACOSQ4_007228 [Xanthoceras sorbifolium]
MCFVVLPGKTVRHFPVLRDTQNRTSRWLNFLGGSNDFQSASDDLSSELNDRRLTLPCSFTVRKSGKKKKRSRRTLNCGSI